jgi:guanosine-3',5'-bis(diphosphate) 3'-pyrophosphohydrolase
MTVRRAVQIAAVAHQDQNDKAGQPYILQALRVMNACSTQSERIVAVLQDVVESGRWTLEELRREGLSDDLVEAVDALTRRPGETHTQSADRVARHPIAQAVRIAELQDNLRAVQVERNASAQSDGRSDHSRSLAPLA